MAPASELPPQPRSNQKHAEFDHLGDPEYVGHKQKVMTEALRESEALFRRIVETAQEGIWLLDVEAKTTFVHRRMAEMLGYTEAEMVGRSLFSFMSQTAAREAQVLLSRRKEGISEFHDFCLVRKNEQPLWAIVSTNALMDDRGRFISALGMCTDITERTLAERQVQAQGALLHLLMDIASAFLALPLDRTDAAIAAALERIARHVGADRAAVVDYDHHRQLGVMTHEWCSDGAPSMIDHRQAIPFAALGDWTTRQWRIHES